MSDFDLMVIGSGPAGLTAALYAQRFGLQTVVFGDTPGGSLYMIHDLANFPAFSGGGTQLGLLLFNQAQQQGATFTMARAAHLSRDNDGFCVVDAMGQSYTAPCVIMATGRTPKHLAIAGANLKGIFFCAICDGPVYRGKNATLAVLGSGNAAAQHAINLARVPAKVLLIHRSAAPLMDAAHRQMVDANPAIEVLAGTEVAAYQGLDTVQAITVKTDAGERQLPVDGVFLAIGWTPNTAMLEMAVAATADGYLKTDAHLMTSVPGLFAAGDCREKDLYQVLTGCADGARAALHARNYRF
jgi:thioredoxin reductase (NADPH)